jgi:hypothetical protein
MIENRYNRRLDILNRTHAVSQWLPISVATAGGVVIVVLLALVATELG